MDHSSATPDDSERQESSEYKSHKTSSTAKNVDKLNARYGIFIQKFIETFAKTIHQDHQITLRAEEPKKDKFLKLAESAAVAISKKILNGPYQFLSIPVQQGIKKGIEKGNNYYKRRKARKVMNGLSQRNPESNVDDLIAERLVEVISILACDICYMYQQQIMLIDGGTSRRYIHAFAEDCVHRIIGYLHARQGRYGLFSKLYNHFIKSTEDMKKKEDELNDVRSTNGAEKNDKIPELAKYLIQGLWKDYGKSDPRPFWLTGSQIQIELKKKDGKKMQKLKVIFNNLIDRVHIKSGNLYYLPFKNCCPIRWLISKIPGRLINAPQDHITRRCGYRLQSLILSSESSDTIPKNCKRVDIKPDPENDYCQEDQALCKLDNFGKLRAFAKEITKSFQE